ncbi:unnamed protein product [Bursaphelenchus okinawaensis]|uniref:Uncharacterized protein n=1 Tax=Bursaphelenchus okinawaensis TaxID=465554 RepID=A0A811KW94_9BILA|nr:unnamed protein product [Bursaphelenchus okinawaensis]CAG9112926.1 unnamed protein product [Bursaphelenchus okinawaensis]
MDYPGMFTYPHDISYLSLDSRARANGTGSVEFESRFRPTHRSHLYYDELFNRLHPQRRSLQPRSSLRSSGSKRVTFEDSLPLPPIQSPKAFELDRSYGYKNKFDNSLESERRYDDVIKSRYNAFRKQQHQDVKDHDDFIRFDDNKKYGELTRYDDLKRYDDVKRCDNVKRYDDTLYQKSSLIEKVVEPVKTVEYVREPLWRDYDSLVSLPTRTTILDYDRPRYLDDGYKKTNSISSFSYDDYEERRYSSRVIRNPYIY